MNEDKVNSDVVQALSNTSQNPDPKAILQAIRNNLNALNVEVPSSVNNILDVLFNGITVLQSFVPEGDKDKVVEIESIILQSLDILYNFEKEVSKVSSLVKKI